MPTATQGAGSQALFLPADTVRKKAKRIFWQILAAGFLTPTLVGIAVKYHLQLSGRPHLEWSELWSDGPLVVLLFIPVIISWIPFVLLAWFARSRVLRIGLVEMPVYGAFVGGEVEAIEIFWGGWHYADEFIFVAIFLLPFFIEGMLIGSGIGWLANMFRPAQGAASQTAPAPADAVQKKANRICWQIMAAGFLTLVMVGIAVKYYLQLTGQPHAEWSHLWSAGPLIVFLLIPVIISWIPFVLLAWFARSLVLRTGLVEKPVYGAFFGGVVGAIAFFWWGWQHVADPIYVARFLLPIWTPIIKGMSIGCGIGWLVNVLRPALRTLPTPVPKSRLL